VAGVPLQVGHPGRPGRLAGRLGTGA
jgi:hypothetical protein